MRKVKILILALLIVVASGCSEKVTYYDRKDGDKGIVAIDAERAYMDVDYKYYNICKNNYKEARSVSEWAIGCKNKDGVAINVTRDIKHSKIAEIMMIVNKDDDDLILKELNKFLKMYGKSSISDAEMATFPNENYTIKPVDGLRYNLINFDNKLILTIIGDKY